MSSALSALLVTSVFGQPQTTPTDGSARPECEQIDAIIEAEAASAGVPLAPIADDAEFLRRVTLDVAGVVPAAEDVRRFLLDEHPGKRGRVIDALLASEECTTRLARFLLEWTTGQRATRVWFANLYEYHEWLQQELRKGATFEAIARAIVTATGTLDGNGAANFTMLQRARPDQLATAVARVFLGSSLGCAQCHDHPSRSYTREQFWGVAAFFARTHSYIVTNGDHGIVDTRFGRIAMPPASSPEFLPENLEHDPAVVAITPRWIDGRPASAEERLREELADLLVDDPQFARNFANRVWERLFGRGLVEPLDDLGAHVVLRELLDHLAAFSRENHCDLRTLIREIVSSRAYQRSCRASGEGDERRFVRALPRPLDVDQLRATFARASGSDAEGSVSPALLVAAKLAMEPQGPRSMGELGLLAPTLGAMSPGAGGPLTVVDPVQALRVSQENVDQLVLELVGGEPGTVHHALVRQNGLMRLCNTLARRAIERHGEPAGPAHVEWICLSLLSRLPDADEIGWIGDLRAISGSDAAWLADVAWTLLNCQEFSHNH